MRSADSGSPTRWPERLQQLVWQLHRAEGAANASVRGNAWQILRVALSGYARFHARKLGPVAEADLLDLTSQKSLDLLDQLDSHQWKPVGESPGQIRAYLSTVARNGVIDLLRRTARMSTLPEPEELAMHEASRSLLRARNCPPSDDIEAADFVVQLRYCVESLSPRARRLWFFRVLYEMPSKWIAKHPEVQMTVGHVDVTLQRCRETIGECMAKKGMKLRVLPPGTFAALWEACVRDRGNLSEEEGHA
jgi:RNA polymerase sigma factor (sigma-70 family)